MSSIFFTGHMIDRPGRPVPRFPDSAAPALAQRIAAELHAVAATDGFAAGANGADILFLEAMIDRGGRAHMTLPCPVDEFRHDCIDTVPGADWGARFERLLQRAATVEVLHQPYATNKALASECCSRVLLGQAQRHATMSGAEARVLALWDGRPGDAYGGTESIVQFCVQHGFKLRWMLDLTAGHEARSRDLAADPEDPIGAAPQLICATVLAEAVSAPGFSECAAEALNAYGSMILTEDISDTSLSVVFQSMRAAGLFALDFRDRAGLDFRAGLHAGPLDGSSESRAGRLDPGIDPGRIFVTSTFAALAAAERVKEFECLAAGRRELISGHGEGTLFEIRRP